MIVEFLLSVLFAALYLPFSVLPDLPATPAVVTTATDWIFDQIAAVAGIAKYLYTEPLFIALFVIAAALAVFVPLYKLVLWILRKIPLINIS